MGRLSPADFHTTSAFAAANWRSWSVCFLRRDSSNTSMPRQSRNQVEPLLIDRAAAAELPSDDGVREWAREKRAFISSVMTELAAERQAVAAGIRGVGLRAVLFEEFGGRDADPEESYLAEVEGSDIYIGIIGRRYGSR